MAVIVKKLKKNVSKISFLKPLYGFLHTVRKNRVIAKELSKISKLATLSEKDIFKYQQDVLFDLLKYAYDQTKYYKNLIDTNRLDITSIDSFKKLPLLNKLIIKENTSSLISKEFGKNNLAQKKTGGSTGNPLEFYCTTKAGLKDYAYHFHQYEKMGYKKRDLILGAGAVTVPQELRDNNIFWIKVGDNQAFGDYKLSILYINKNNIQHYVNKLLELKPNLLRGYPSLFDSLAQYILTNNISLNFKIKGISLTSEICSRNQRINIEKAFSSKVYFEYGHKEVSVLSHTWGTNDVYKSYPSYGYVEVLNEDGSETPLGEIGKIVVTGFLNRGMPFIRYDTEDLCRVTYRSGGVVNFSEIIGRSQDFIITKSKVKLSILVLATMYFKAFNNIEKWQIVQENEGEINILIIKGLNFSIDDEIEIGTKIKNIADLNIRFVYVNDIKRTMGGKHLFLVQKLKL